MDIILCHTTADFDTLGAAVGLTRLLPGAKIVLTGGCHPTVQDFLALHRDEYALIERRSVRVEQISQVIVVDTQSRERLGKAAEWLSLPHIARTVYDHHLNAVSDLAPPDCPLTAIIEPVGAATTLIVEQLQTQQLTLTPSEATVMALGIHADTGSLTFDHTTVRDAAALTWLMQQGANLRVVGEYIEPGLSPQLQDLLTVALEELTVETIHGYGLGWVLLSTETYVGGLSSLASQLINLTEIDVLLLAVQTQLPSQTQLPAQTQVPAPGKTGEIEERLTVIGRSRSNIKANATQGLHQGLHLGQIFQAWGGGGHPRAAALTLRGVDSAAVLQELVEQVSQHIPYPPLARDLMSSPVRTVRPETTIEEAQRVLLRYGHSGLSVVDAADQLVGVISRRDLDIALRHGFGHAPVKGYMTTNLKTITPDTPLPEIEALMMTFDIGRLPVLAAGQLVGIVTRTDVLRQLHQDGLRERRGGQTAHSPLNVCPLPEVMLTSLQNRLVPALWEVLMRAASEAEQRGWQLYLVGGAVRDLLLSDMGTDTGTDTGADAGHITSNQSLWLGDLDLVVDGFHATADQAAGVELARSLQPFYPEMRLQIHGRFQTAALLWHHDPDLDSLWIDIATARTEFYPYPAANPEVESSSIQQDLYRRDFTINALAIRLTAPYPGVLLDFFGGSLDLQAKQIRVLHANSLIEDPTRIFRAVRFAVRLGFQIDPQTEGYIRHALASGIYRQVQADRAKVPALQTRLRQELKHILEAHYWKPALELLDDLGAIDCIHPDLRLTPVLWQQLRLVDRWLKRFDPAETIPHWLILLELILLQLAPEIRVAIAENLQLPHSTIQRLGELEQHQQMLLANLPSCERPSQVSQILHPFDHATLVLLAITLPRPIRHQIWRYITCWAQIKAPIDGQALKALGYKPGKQFKQILYHLKMATIDGGICNQTEAELFLKQHFPIQSI